MQGCKLWSYLTGDLARIHPKKDRNPSNPPVFNDIFAVQTRFDFEWAFLKAEKASALWRTGDGRMAAQDERSRMVKTIQAKVLDARHLELSEPVSISPGKRVTVSVADPEGPGPDRSRGLGAASATGTRLVPYSWGRSPSICRPVAGP